MADPIHAFEADGTPSPGAQTALNGKANTSHTHAQADVTGLPDALAAINYDSGPRDWSSRLTTGWTGVVWARRIGRVMQISIEGITPDANASATVLALPAGFIPATIRDGSAVRARLELHSTATTPTMRRGYLNTNLVLSNHVVGETLYGTVTVLTDDTIPT